MGLSKTIAIDKTIMKNEILCHKERHHVPQKENDIYSFQEKESVIFIFIFEESCIIVFGCEEIKFWLGRAVEDDGQHYCASMRVAGQMHTHSGGSSC